MSNLSVWLPDEASLLIDGNAVDSLDPSVDEPHFAYQTTESTNGTHTVTVELTAGMDPQSVASASTTLVFNNELSSFCAVDAGDDSANEEAVYVYGVWTTPRDWTIEITDASDNPVRTVTGFGSVVDYTWDGNDNSGNPTYEESMYNVELKPSSGGAAPASASASQAGKTAVFRKAKIRYMPTYISFYPDTDFAHPTWVSYFRTRCRYATERLKFRFQSAGLSQDPYAVPEDGWQFPVLGDSWDYGYMDDARILHYTGHGSNGGIGGQYYASFWYGLAAVHDEYHTEWTYYGIADHFMNTKTGRSPITGQIWNVFIPVRYRAVFLDGCNTGSIIGRHLPLTYAFGIVHTTPTGKVSKGSIYIGWNGPGYPWDSVQNTFIDWFWYNLVTMRLSAGNAVKSAIRHSGIPRNTVRVVGDTGMHL